MPHHDADLAALLPEITGPSGQFRHRQHIHLAFLAVRRYGMPEATTRICGWIRRIAAYERAPQKYHHTISRAWVEIVAHHVGDDPGCADFGTFADRHPALLDKRLLARHYRSSTLAAAPARSGWVEPDLLPFPMTEGLRHLAAEAGLYPWYEITFYPAADALTSGCADDRRMSVSRRHGGGRDG
jgi:hypothetical protein